ncbi:CDP-alcohol phosphatidyltransferase family protein [Agrococcus lahaulensis]|nr:CDP-alcohol phosphatidyltransferase family protein [Agrococcus lahaulensis]
MAPAPARERDPDDPYFTRVLTLPNAITLARLLLLAPVCWLIVAGADGSWLPVVLLALWASTDWIDGVLARAMDQTSRVGEVMDPVADRIGIIGVTLSLAIAGAVDWWILAVIAGVDVIAVAFAGRAARDGGIHVSWLGKVRTALMLTAVVLLLVGHTVLPWVTPIAMTLMLLGLGLHVIACVDYILQARRLRRVQTGALARPAAGDAHAQDDTEEAR